VDETKFYIGTIQRVMQQCVGIQQINIENSITIRNEKIVLSIRYQSIS
jgi:hypothetical protein